MRGSLAVVALLAQAGADGSCSFSSGCSWDKLPFKCTNPALSVDYTNVATYSGVVSCGNLFLEADIGGGINIAPLVIWPAAKADAYYTIMMIDPDADVDGSFPNIHAAGSHAPVRHWIQGNVPGSALAQGSIAGSDVVSPFHGPSPPAGSHRYGQFIFEQAGQQKFVAFNATASIAQFDYAAWLVQNGLKDAVASNWHITKHS